MKGRGLTRRGALAGTAWLAGCAALGSDGGAGPDAELKELLLGTPGLADIAERSKEHRLQVLVAEVRGGRVLRHGFRVDAEYFYPASAIKLLSAVAALEWLGAARKRMPVDLDSPLVFRPLFDDESREDADPSNRDGGAITLGHEVRKLFLVSDNRAHNRCYELVGHRALHTSAWEAGLKSVRQVHRLSEARSFEDNLRTPAVEVRLADGRVHVVPARTSDRPVTSEHVPGCVLDLAFARGGKVTPAPTDFGTKNSISLRDLQDALILTARPDLVPELAGFRLADDHRAFALEAMREQPRDSTNPAYDPAEYPTDRLKYLARGVARVLPRERFDCFNKVGRAYGFSIDNARFVDRETGRELFVAVTVMTNPNRILNDGVYAYREVADPFLADLGEAVARRWLSGS